MTGASPEAFARAFVFLLVVLLWRLSAGDLVSAEMAARPAIEAFLTQHCRDCHQGADGEGAFDLETLGWQLQDPAAEKRWVRLVDRVAAGEMPPADAEQPAAEARAKFVREAGEWLRAFQSQRDTEVGRVRARRLTRREVERSLHALLGIDIPLAELLPEDAKSNGFTTVADGQAMSHFQLEAHLSAVDAALDEAFRRAFSEEDRYERDYDAQEVARTNPRRRTREPEMRAGQAVVWSSGLIFYGRIPATTAPESGWYRFKVRVSGLKLPPHGGVWSTVNSGLCVSSAPLLTPITVFEATDTPRDIEFEAWLPRRHMLEIRPGDTTIKKARFAGGQVGVGEGEPQDVPGIAIDRITMERIHRGAKNADIRRLLFGDLPVELAKRNEPGKLVSNAPREDARRLVRDFAERVFRRPTSDHDLAKYQQLAAEALERGEDLAAALRVAYRAILCSPRFLYFTEQPGQLDDFAIATRLSYFLTGATPDARLRELAAAGRLSSPAVLRQEAERLLAGPSGARFVQDFAAEWLDLDQINFTEPDRKLFPEFDATVQHAMLAETHLFLETMLRDNLSVSHLIDSDFSFLNGRLARYYEIDGVTGDEMRRVELSAADHRGGVLTQGAILKVTANGSNTSPVVRGVWVSERLLGTPIPPPPENVPAIEPDIRGAKTIREQLAKHRSQDSCAVCHVKIDPPGFALENFDPAGQWRERYLQLVNGRRTRGAAVDPSYEMPDGRQFQDIEGFRSLVAAEPRRLAANVAEKMLVFGTGAPISFKDREAVEQIVDKVTEQQFGFRSILFEVVTSPAFMTK